MLDSISKNIQLQYFILFIVAFFAFSNTLNHSYVWDDALVIQQNEYTKDGFSGLKDIWTKKVFLHNRNVYRPIPQSIYAITYQIAPNNPTAAHFVNVLFYTLIIVVTFWFLSLLFSKQNKWLLFFISLLFALHPVHTEVVANIKSLDEILAYLFGLLSLSFWTIYIKEKKIQSLYLTFLFFFLALLSKISAITFLAIFPLIYLLSIDDVKEKMEENLKRLKDFFSNKILSKKTIIIFVTFLILLGFIFIKKQLFTLTLPLIVLFAFLLFKTNQKHLKLALFLLLTIILSAFNFQISIIILSIIFSHFLIIKNNVSKLFIGLLLLIFITTFALLNLNLASIVFSFFLAAFPFLFSLKKDKIMLFILGIISIIVFFLDTEINVTNIMLLLLFLYFGLNKKINFKILFFILFITALLFDAFFIKKFNSFQKINLSTQIIQVENNQDVSVGMTTLHNTLWEENDPEIKFATIAKIQIKYLQLLFYPHPLVHQYGYNQITKTTFKDWKVWFSIIIHLALFFFALFKLKDKSPISFGILFYLATISIYTNIVILMPDTLAERFLFSSSLGFCIAFVFGINEIFKAFKIKKVNLAISLFFIPILLAFSYKTIDRNKAWKNNFTLAKNTIKNAPNNAAINAQYATEILLKNGDSTLIIKHYKRAIEIYPDFYSATKDLANFYVSLKQPYNAEKLLLKCIELNKKDWESYYFLAFINYENKNYIQAIPFFQNTLKYGDKFIGKEKYLYSSEFLARCYFNNNQIPLADKLLKENYKKYQAKSSIVLLGNIYHQSGNTQKSLEIYSSLLADFPNDQDLLKTIKILKESLN